MPISLVKGQKISLAKEAGKDSNGLSKILIGLGWDVKKKGGFFGLGASAGDDIDLDASAGLYNEANELVDLVWFRHLNSNDGSVHHSGDNRTGGGDGDDESITIDLAHISANIKTVVVTVNSFRGQTFDTVENAFVRAVDCSNGKEIAKYNLSCTGRHTGQIMAKIYRHNGEWKMCAIGENATGRTYMDMSSAIALHL